MTMTTINQELLSKIDNNNLKALGIIKNILFTLVHGGDCNEHDVVSTLEAVQDYLADTSDIFSSEI